MRALFLCCLAVALFAGASASECSSGDTNYMCTNLQTCWSDLGFGSISDLQYLCEIQGYTYDDVGGNQASQYQVQITTPIVNLTIPLGASANFRCSADDAVQIVIGKSTEFTPKVFGSEQDTVPSMQTTIQEIEQANYEDEGWYTCTAYGVDSTQVTVEAYLEIRDVCENNDCEAPKICQADPYTATYECVCPDDCDATFDPVCGSDCQSYFNECTMKKETCEKGLAGVTVLSRGLCSFSPSMPYFTETPDNDYRFKQGERFSIFAEAQGTPTPGFKWFVNGEELTDGFDIGGTGGLSSAGTGRSTFADRMNRNYEGDWSVVASSCMGSFEYTFGFRVTMEQSEVNPVEPAEQCCKVYGDPHILTFDGLAYDYMGIGTFVIAQDQVAGEWVVYGTFEQCGDKTKQLSCIVSITVFYKYDMVQFLRMWRINSNGQDSSVALGQTGYFGQIKVENVALKYIITLGDTGIVVKWDGIITSEVCVASCSGGTGGLCANANCDPSDEFDMRGFMNPYTRSWKAANSAEFGNSWAVGDDVTKEPEDGSLSIENARPCDRVDAGVRNWVQSRCDAVFALDYFSVLSQTTIEAQTALTNCYYDGCVGVAFGFDLCADSFAVDCPADIADEISTIMAVTGMSRAEALARMRSKYGYDSACMMGMGFVRDLSTWSVQVDMDWRQGVDPPCPSDEALAEMRICP